MIDDHGEEPPHGHYHYDHSSIAEKVVATSGVMMADTGNNTSRGHTIGGYLSLDDDDAKALPLSASPDCDEESGFVVVAGQGCSKLGRNQADYVGINVRARTEDEAGPCEAGAAEDNDGDNTSLRLAIFGALNVAYVVLQLWGSMAFGSLALLSDGFHNLSDVAAIGMAMYIHKLQHRNCPENAPGGSDQLPFGYKRAEVIGGLINSVALVSLSAYIVLNSIPRFFAPTKVDAGWPYIILAFMGVIVNFVGVLLFLTAGSHEHDHLHAGGFLNAHNHSHDHGHELRPASPSAGPGLLESADRYESSTSVSSGSPMSSRDTHGGFSREAGEVSVILAGSHHPLVGRNADTINGSVVQGETFLLGEGSGEGAALKAGGREMGLGEEDEWIGGGRGVPCLDTGRSHDHGHVNGLCHRRHKSDGGSESNGHHHGNDDEGFRAHEHGGACNGGGGHHEHHLDHGHSGPSAVVCDAHKGQHGKHMTHDHSHEHSHGHGEHGHGHEEHDDDGHHHCGGAQGVASGGGCSAGKSMNIWAMLVHAVADAISSGIVCAQGALIFMFHGSDQEQGSWTDYLDPITSIGLSVYIACTATPVIVECAHVLLEGTPRSASMARLRKEIARIRGICSVQRLSVIQLNSEEKYVATATLAVRGSEAGDAAEWARVLDETKRVLAKHNIDHSTVELVPEESKGADQGGGRVVSKNERPRERGSQLMHRHHHQDGGGLGETYDKPPTVLSALAAPAVETACVSPIESCSGEGGDDRDRGNFPSYHGENHHAHNHVHGQREERSQSGHANGSGHSRKCHSGDGHSHSHSHAQACGHPVVNHDMVCVNGSTVDLV